MHLYNTSIQQFQTTSDKTRPTFKNIARYGVFGSLRHVKTLANPNRASHAVKSNVNTIKHFQNRRQLNLNKSNLKNQTFRRVFCTFPVCWASKALNACHKLFWTSPVVAILTYFDHVTSSTGNNAPDTFAHLSTTKNVNVAVTRRGSNCNYSTGPQQCRKYVMANKDYRKYENINLKG